MQRVALSVSTKAHTIASGPKFVAGTNDGEMVCSCGDTMLGSQFSAHRRDNANGKRLRFALKVPVGYDQTPGWMRESRARRAQRERKAAAAASTG